MTRGTFTGLLAASTARRPWASWTAATAWGASAGLAAAAGLSITAGYHRLFAHRGYKAHKVVRFFYAVLGAAALRRARQG